MQGRRGHVPGSATQAGTRARCTGQSGDRRNTGSDTHHSLTHTHTHTHRHVLYINTEGSAFLSTFIRVFNEWGRSDVDDMITQMISNVPHLMELFKIKAAVLLMCLLDMILTQPATSVILREQTYENIVFRNTGSLMTISRYMNCVQQHSVVCVYLQPLTHFMPALRKTSQALCYSPRELLSTPTARKQQMTVTTKSQKQTSSHYRCESPNP